jgi:hypothetical protein
VEPAESLDRHFGNGGACEAPARDRRGRRDREVEINAQYWPKTGHEQLVRHTLLHGQWVRGGSTVHAYFDFGRVVGYDGGKPSTNHRAEITQATPPQMHGHPRISKD